jgi:hypothetical protein
LNDAAAKLIAKMLVHKSLGNAQRTLASIDGVVFTAYERIGVAF